VANRYLSGRGPVRPHILKGGGLSREITDLRKDVDDAFTQVQVEIDQIIEGGGGGGGGGPARTILNCTCTAAEAVQDVVQIVGGTTAPDVRKVDITNPTNIGVGLIISKDSPTTCQVQLTGIAEIANSFTVNSTLFVGLNGRLQEGPPAQPVSGKLVVHPVARVITNNLLMLSLQQPTIAVAL
jgi:hypothetical protein